MQRESKKKWKLNFLWYQHLGSSQYQDHNSLSCHSALSMPKDFILLVVSDCKRSDDKLVVIKFSDGNPTKIATFCHEMIDTGITPDFSTANGSEVRTGAAPPKVQNAKNTIAGRTGACEWDACWGKSTQYNNNHC
eukprot:13879249-Ditylum_brightwellii.AAC.1